jgi:hypothetical protein
MRILISRRFYLIPRKHNLGCWHHGGENQIDKTFEEMLYEICGLFARHFHDYIRGCIGERGSTESGV